MTIRLAIPLLAAWLVLPAPAKTLGIDYGGAEAAKIEALGPDDLLGALKMSGIWVSKLTLEEWADTAVAFCRFGRERAQSPWLQLPIDGPHEALDAAFRTVARSGCRPAGLTVGNEVDHLVKNGIARTYAVADYVRDYNRVVPIARRHFPKAKVAALELSGFGDEAIDGWLLPFLRAKLAVRPDYVSIHYYPFDGSQKAWETLAAPTMLAERLKALAPRLKGAPPILVGEYNVTYQYEPDTTYPESGGGGFMAALTVPGVFATPGIAGVFHWSLVEGGASTLGLFAGEPPRPVPMLAGYRLASLLSGLDPVAVDPGRPDLDAYAGASKDRWAAIFVNRSPFFRRDVEHQRTRLTLAPFSVTAITGSPANPQARSTTSFSLADPRLRSGTAAPSPSCATLADFAEPRVPGAHARGAAHDQDRKIATGGTVAALASPGAKATVDREADRLAVSCEIPAEGRGYSQCGVKLPLVTDARTDRRQGADWREGEAHGFFRITAEASPPVDLEIHLDDFEPEKAKWNTHQAALRVDGARAIDVALRDLRQSPGEGAARSLGEVLANAAAIRIEARRAGWSGRFFLRKVEICDR